MSLNSLTERKYVHSVKAFRGLFQRIMEAQRRPITVEEKLRTEINVLTTIQELVNFESLQIAEVRPVNHLQVSEFNYPRRMFSYMILMNNIRIESVSELYLNYLNNQKTDLLEIYGKIKRIKQKKATLELWGGEFKYVLNEHFLNLDNLSTKYTSVPMCSVDTVSGCLTLPIIASKVITPTKVSLGSGSNGYVGTAEVEINTDNRDPNYVFDGNQETWFQYEGASGPLNLVLVCELNTTDVINQIDIEPANIGTFVNYSVKDVTFTSSGKETFSLREMVDGEVDDDYFTVKSSENDSYWSCKFLPVRCQQVIVHLEQSSNQKLKTYSPVGDEVSSSRFSIGVKSISFKRNEYASIGGINSVETPINQGLYAAQVTSTSFPKKDTLYNIYADVSFNSGETWESDIYSLVDVDNKTMLLDGSAENALWRLRLERNDQGFADARSLTDEEVEFDIASKQRMVSKFVSPVKIALDEKPLTKEIHVIQPKVGRKTSRRKDSLRLGRGVGGALTRFPLGFSLNQVGVDVDDLHVYVNGIEWFRIDDSGSDELSPSATLGEFHLSKNEDALIFSDDLADKSVVTFRFDEERVLWQEASDGYYAFLSASFDPDPMNIKVNGRPISGRRLSKILPKGKRKIYLGYKDIVHELGGSLVEFVSDSTYTFTEKTSIHEVNSGTPGGTEIFYYLDSENGILHLNPAINDNQNVKFTFKHLNPTVISSDKLKVITNGIKPIGIRVDKDSLQLTEYEDGSRTQRDKRFNPGTKVYGRREVSISDPAPGKKATVLTHDYIVEGTVIVDSSILEGHSSTDFPMVEVEYQDGASEFLGLVQMDSEKTISIIADSTGIVSFSLAAGSAIYKEFGVSFDDPVTFNPAQEETTLASLESLGATSTGSYYIDYSKGIVYVIVGAGKELKEGIGISYSYRDLSLDSDNLFSVDYRNGILYTAKEQKESSEVKNIKYKASQHTVSYDLAKEIDLYRYNVSKNVVSIRTEGMSDINNLVKIVWAKAEIKPSLEGVRRYFSPIVYTFGIRFQ